LASPNMVTVTTSPLTAPSSGERVDWSADQVTLGSSSQQNRA
jgi:hypothetical protein